MTYIARRDLGNYAALVDCVQPRRGLGAAMADIDAFKARYADLKRAIISANRDSDDPLDDKTLNAAIQHMDNVYNSILAGQYGRAPALETTARNILTAVGQKQPTDYVESLLRAILTIPHQVAVAVVDAAHTAGDVVKAVGINPNLLIGAVIVVGVAALALKFG